LGFVNSIHPRHQEITRRWSGAARRVRFSPCEHRELVAA